MGFDIRGAADLETVSVRNVRLHSRHMSWAVLGGGSMVVGENEIPNELKYIPFYYHIHIFYSLSTSQSAELQR